MSEFKVSLEDHEKIVGRMGELVNLRTRLGKFLCDIETVKEEHEERLKRFNEEQKRLIDIIRKKEKEFSSLYDTIRTNYIGEISDKDLYEYDHQKQKFVPPKAPDIKLVSKEELEDED